jgi:hypothetical protein
VHFAPGELDTGSARGQELLGHELTHVVQQRSGQVAAPQGKGAPINSDAALEDEADRMGERAARGEPVQVTGAGGGTQLKAIEGSVIQCASRGGQAKKEMARGFGNRGRGGGRGNQRGRGRGGNNQGRTTDSRYAPPTTTTTTTEDPSSESDDDDENLDVAPSSSSSSANSSSNSSSSSSSSNYNSSSSSYATNPSNSSNTSKVSKVSKTSNTSNTSNSSSDDQALVQSASSLEALLCMNEVPTEVTDVILGMKFDLELGAAADSEKSSDVVRRAFNGLKALWKKHFGGKTMADMQVLRWLVEAHRVLVMIDDLENDTEKESIERLRLAQVKPSYRFAFCIERIMEIKLNIAAAGKNLTAAGAAGYYGSALKKAFGIENTNDTGFNTDTGFHQMPKTLDAVVTTYADGPRGVFLGQNSGQYAKENQYRASQIDRDVKANKKVIEDNVSGSLVENERDELNCAECLAIARARKTKPITSDSQAVRREETNEYKACKPCENCKQLYDLKDHEEIADENNDVKKEKKEAADKAIQDAHRHGSKQAVAERNAQAQTFENEVKQAVAQLDPALRQAYQRLGKYISTVNLKRDWKMGGDNQALLLEYIRKAKKEAGEPEDKEKKGKKKK